MTESDCLKTRSKVVSASDLLTRLAEDKAAGCKIVVTNGVFDLMHVGHLRYLQQAAALGDCLVILLNDDASVQANKGPSRPIVCQDDRAEMLAGLACVRYVSLFSGTSPADRLAAIKPDVYVKGADYTLETLPERDVIEHLGCQVAFVPFVSGKSTTALIQRIIATTPTALA